MTESLKPCPFCGGAARIDSNRDWHLLHVAHDDDCVLDADQADLRFPAQPGYLIEIAEVWNRRATPPSPSTAEDERAAFEAWARRQSSVELSLLPESVEGMGVYRSGHTQWLYDGWLARAALSANAADREAKEHAATKGS